MTKLDTGHRDKISATHFAFPKQRKEPLEDGKEDLFVTPRPGGSAANTPCYDTLREGGYPGYRRI